MQAVEEELAALRRANDVLRDAILELDGPPRQPKKGQIYLDAMSPGFTYVIDWVDPDSGLIGYSQMRNDAIVAGDTIEASAWPRFHRQRTLRRAT